MKTTNALPVRLMQTVAICLIQVPWLAMPSLDSVSNVPKIAIAQAILPFVILFCSSVLLAQTQTHLTAMKIVSSAKLMYSSVYSVLATVIAHQTLRTPFVIQMFAPNVRSMTIALSSQVPMCVQVMGV